MTIKTNQNITIYEKPASVNAGAITNKSIGN